MGVYRSCKNCGNEEGGTDLYLCWGGHRYCNECAIITQFDILGYSCPICEEGHKDTYGEIAEDDQEVDDEEEEDDEE